MDLLLLLLIPLVECSMYVLRCERPEGYISKPHYDCPGNNILGGLNTQSFGQCLHICEVHSQCVAFAYTNENSAGNNCWVKDQCQHPVFRFSYYTLCLYQRISNSTGCTFDSTPGYALYGHNDEIVESVDVNFCKKKCLIDKKCLSFDYNGRKSICFLSHDSKDTDPSLFQQHYAMTYYQKRCGNDTEKLSPEVYNANQGATIWMNGGLCIKTFGPYGSPYGDYFSDDNVQENITEIEVDIRTTISRVGMKYGSSPMMSHGRGSSNKVTTQLNAGEYITQIEGEYQTAINKLTIVTNQRILGPYGSSNGRAFTATGNGKPLLYISGSVNFSGTRIMSLSFHFSC